MRGRGRWWGIGNCRLVIGNCGGGIALTPALSRLRERGNRRLRVGLVGGWLVSSDWGLGGGGWAGLFLEFGEEFVNAGQVGAGFV